MASYTDIMRQIIKSQETIIGPIALEQARKVEGVEIENLDSIKVAGNEKDVLKNLVEQYVKLFGRASIEVCKEAVRSITPPVTPEQLPDILK